MAKKISTRRMKGSGSGTAHRVTIDGDDKRALCGINIQTWYPANGSQYQNCAGCEFIEQEIKAGRVKGR